MSSAELDRVASSGTLRDLIRWFGADAATLDEVAKVLADPAIKAKSDAAGLFPVTSTPAEFSAFIRKEAERWSAVVKETGMKYD